MQLSPLREIANELPFFKTVDDREKLLGVIGALVLRKISLSKASDLGLLDGMKLGYSYLEDQDVEVESKW